MLEILDAWAWIVDDVSWFRLSRLTRLANSFRMFHPAVWSYIFIG